MIFSDWNDEPEQFWFVGNGWDVAAAKAILARAPREAVEFDVADVSDLVGERPKECTDSGKWTISLGVAIDWSKVDSDEVDLAVPVVIVETPHGHLPVDGWHRIAKAVDAGVESLPCVVLTRAETLEVEL